MTDGELAAPLSPGETVELKDGSPKLLTAENLRKRDSLMMLDEEARMLVQEELQ